MNTEHRNAAHFVGDELTHNTQQREGHRYVTCLQCVDDHRRITDRDVNAARNMRIVGVEVLRTGERPGPFEFGSPQDPVPPIPRNPRGMNCATYDADRRRATRQRMRHAKQERRRAEMQQHNPIDNNAVV